MTKKHLELAAKLWSLALVAHTDSCGVDALSDKVRAVARDRASAELEQLGTDRTRIHDEQDAAYEAGRLIHDQNQNRKTTLRLLSVLNKRSVRKL